MAELIRYLLLFVFYTWPLFAAWLVYSTWQNKRKKEWVVEHENVVLSVIVPKENDKGAIAAEMLFASLHGILKPNKEHKKEGSVQEHLGFEIVADHKSIRFYIWTPAHLKDFVEGQVYAQYPKAEIKEVLDYSKDIDIDGDGINDAIAGCEMGLVKSEVYPIKTFTDFDVDPLAAITGALSRLEEEHEKVWIQILVRPAEDNWQQKSLVHVEFTKAGKSSLTKESIIQTIIKSPITIGSELFKRAMTPPETKTKTKAEAPQLTETEKAGLKAVELKASKLAFHTKIRIVYLSKRKDLAASRLQSATAAFKQFNSLQLNGFAPGTISTSNDFLKVYQARFFTDPGYILNIEELASLYHLPYLSVEIPGLVKTTSKKGEPPLNLPTEGSAPEGELTPFAETNFRGQRIKFGILKPDRRRHMYIIGKSGVGKSKLLELMAISDIQKGNGLAIIDPHGDLAEEILRHIPSYRMKDVIYFNPADKNFPIGFNALECPDPDFRETIASGFVGILKKLFGYSWGPRLEHILRYTVLALLETPDTTMLGIVEMLTNKNYRKKIVQQIQNPAVKSFWTNEFATYNDRFATEAVAPILNKVGQFVASTTIRNIVGQPKSKLDLRKVMDEGKILIVNLSSGRIGEDNTALLGSLMITKLQLAAMSRADVPEEERRDFYLYVDEFQNFATESFAKILSEARKYRLDLIVANQYIAQMEEIVKEAIFGNAGTLISFRVGASDAQYLQKEFLPVFEENDIANLDVRDIYIKMGINGITSSAFSARTLDVSQKGEDLTQDIIDASRERYGTGKEEVEEKINRWARAESEEGGEKDSTEARQARAPFRQEKREYAKVIEKTKTQGEHFEKKVSREEDKTKEFKKPESHYSRPPFKKHSSVNPQELKELIKNVTQKKSSPENQKREEGSSFDPKETQSKVLFQNNPKPDPAESQTTRADVAADTNHQKAAADHNLHEIKPGEVIEFKE